ncbi:uncharacterized protein [Physcomitrium patens]|uniref:Uncharacterized protein n=1 Tax=Physcomitrium patens TaxID=3218 RepID=A0A2K1ICK9_PHYPA|nr:uncharacterized protein LOC112278027 [Physcomitrium patens]PNR27008.1 hypothetical protein PHYPA_030489 [Physcomitrium patens]|eukprot:XP_024366783.1 uncharacterized protein LOC112278027 [Physcomitrella patens]
MASQRAPSTSMLAAAWCDRLNQFCTQLQKNCSSLHSIVQRKPESQSRDHNFDIFLEDLNEDITSALAELQHLEERTTDTLSFEELLVHCDALYKSNEDGIAKLELQLQQYGYTPVEVPKQTHIEVLHGHSHQEIETKSHILDEAISPPRSGVTPPSVNENETSITTPVALSYSAKNTKRDVEYSPLFGDLGDLENLESLGISATSLTALASQDEPVSSVHPLQHKLTFVESPKKDVMISMRDSEIEDNLKTKFGSHRPSEADIKHIPLPSTSDSMFDSTYGHDSIPVVFNKPVNGCGIGSTNSTTTTTFSTRDETVQSVETNNVPSLTEISSVQYDNLPIWLRSQVSLQELNGAVAKINDLVSQRTIGGQHATQFFLDQKDVQALGLGSKARAGIMLLTKADKIVTQNINGVTTYRICV